MADVYDNVIPFRTAKPLTDDEIICRAVDRALVEHVSNTKLLQARVRAMNLFHAGIQMNDALTRAIAWGRSTTDEGNPPKDVA